MKYALVYGLISGSVVVLTMIAGFALTGPDSFTRTLWYGYSLMLVVEVPFIFIGVKRYRDVECGGTVGFLRALGVGVGMAAFGAVAYVAIWEAYLAATGYHYLEAMVSGTPAADRAEVEAMLYNPLVRVPFESLELFPVGLIVALLSAWALRFPNVLPATVRAAGGEQAQERKEEVGVQLI